MTEEQNKAQKRIMELMKNRVHPSILNVRQTKDFRMSYYTIGTFKSLIDILSKMSEEEIAELKSLPTPVNSYPYSGYIEAGMKFVEKARQKDQQQKSVGNYKHVIDKIKTELEPFILEREQEIAESITVMRSNISLEYKQLGYAEFAKKYGEQDKRDPSRWRLDKFYGTFKGRLLNLWDADLPKFIKREQKRYRDGEYNKVETLIYRLEQKFPALTNLKMIDFYRSFAGLEFRMEANNEGKEIHIHTHTIYAGGYNIQRLHLRWLMKVMDQTFNTLDEIKS